MFDESFASLLPANTFDLIVSNPPYIPDSEWEGLQREVKQYEPRIALTSPQGSECYVAIVTKAKKLLVPGGKLCFELHADAGTSVSELMAAEGFSAITVYKDYSGLDRVISGVFPIGN